LLHFGAEFGSDQRFPGFVFKPIVYFFCHEYRRSGGLKVEKIF
jgi:hypothetical protein